MILKWLTEEFAQHLGQALEMMSGEKAAITTEPGTAAAPATGDIVFEQPFNIEGTCAWLSAPLEAWVSVGAHLLKAAGIEDHDETTAKSTFNETLNQGFSGLSREVGGRVFKELVPAGGAEIEASPAGLKWNKLEIKLSDAVTVRFLVAFSAELEKLLDAAARGVDPEEEKAVVPKAGGALVNVEGSRTLELLLDVELPVSVSFGRAHLPIKDVIKLTTGSIVELNRTVGEPVEVIVNNCVIARGEVVVVEGNFGVRIQEVISKQERLRTLY